MSALAYADAHPTYPIEWVCVDSVYSARNVALPYEVGTGGASTHAYFQVRGNTGYRIVRIPLPKAEEPAPVVEATPLDNLEKVRAILNPAVSDLARALDVSRQSLYEWMGGGPMSQENARKVKELARVADLFNAVGLKANNNLLRREIGGRTFYDRFRGGESAEEAGCLLVDVARREAEQREALNRRLKNRPQSTMSYEDLGSPHLSETD